jgi:hypothetical protein
MIDLAHARTVVGRMDLGFMKTKQNMICIQAKYDSCLVGIMSTRLYGAAALRRCGKGGGLLRILTSEVSSYKRVEAITVLLSQ